MQPCIEAYLDIETTGLSPLYSTVTVVGIYICKGDTTEFVHLVGEDITVENILGALQGVGVLYTYNGKGFDLPFIHRCVGVNLAELLEHHDLMFDCWRNNLYGGFKSVERQLGIDRKLTEVDGYEAVRLWWRYINDYDKKALGTLLEYNREDVLNLRALRHKLLPQQEEI